eukprot:TRINITY_DN305_c0_g2_i1.p1 TRINITY_DN305_c0_g2~~TRINITY_DN305_c0_g2_i1.p1  ORF type:complete len:516 (-),score=161.60 TRINITY_DN305_c0_g2_i1:37-1584(-)
MDGNMELENKKKRKSDKKEKKDKEKKEKRKSEKQEKKRKRSEEESGEDTPKKKQKISNDSTNGSTTPTDEKSFLSDDTDFINKYREENEIVVEGHVTNFKPFETFSEGKFPSDLLQITKGFEKPTPIQSQCWPIILSNKDLVGIAETGSGKTLAFGIPGLMYLKSISSKAARSFGKQPSMLVLSPTRELAMQTAEVLEKAGKASNFKSACIYGGVAKGPQNEALRSGLHIVVATPGRLLDLINEGTCDIKNVTFLVLDEADRMLDAGFEKEIRTIIGMTSKERQTVMFSATWPQSIQQLASTFMTNPIKVTIGSDSLSANKRVEQIVEVIDSDARDKRLLELLNEYHKSRKNRVLVFALYKKEASRLESFLNNKGWKSVSIHGDKSQAHRTQALQDFIDAKIPLLIATDVAARGLHIPKVEYVINYSFPLTVEDYIHRIGRTGRAGAKGVSHTFFSKFDKAHSGALIGVLKDAKQKVPEDLLAFGVATKKKEPKLGKIETTQKPSSHITFDSDDE